MQFEREIISERTRDKIGAMRRKGKHWGAKPILGYDIVRDPACFLFDEPLSNLDAKLRVETRAELKRLHHRLQTTTIYVTHDQEEAMTLGDVVVVMSDGLIQQAAPPLTVYENPANRFVAGFVGTPPMNFLDGQLLQRDGRTWFESDGARLKLEGHHAEAVSGKLGQDVVMGIRPEGLYLRANEHAGNEEQTITVNASVVEPLGSQMDIFCHTSGDHRLVARVKAERFEPRSQLKLYVDQSKVYLFEPGLYGDHLTCNDQNATAASTGLALL